MAIVLLSGCQTSRIDQELTHSFDQEGATTAIGAQEYKIALLLPLTGAHSAMGTSMRQAAEMALFDMADNSMKLIPLDTQGTPGGAKKAAHQALQKKVDLILGPVFAPNARHVKSMLHSSSIPVITYSTDLSLAEPGFFVFGFDVVEQIRAVTKYAASKDIHTIVAILPNNAYGHVVEDELNSLHALHQIQVTNIFKYDRSDRNFSEIAEKIKLADVQGILIPEGGSQLTMILSSLAYHDLTLTDYQLLGTGQWDHPTVVYHKTANGGWFANPSARDRGSFESRYTKTYGSSPHRLASLAYDTLSMATMLVRLHPRDPFSIASMTHTRGFTGADGLFRLLSNGDTERALAIYQVRSGSIEVIHPAASSF